MPRPSSSSKKTETKHAQDELNISNDEDDTPVLKTKTKPTKASTKSESKESKTSESKESKTNTKAKKAEVVVDDTSVTDFLNNDGVVTPFDAKLVKTIQNTSLCARSNELMASLKDEGKFKKLMKNDEDKEFLEYLLSEFNNNLNSEYERFYAKHVCGYVSSIPKEGEKKEENDYDKFRKANKNTSSADYVKAVSVFLSKSSKNTNIFKGRKFEDFKLLKLLSKNLYKKPNSTLKGDERNNETKAWKDKITAIKSYVESKNSVDKYERDANSKSVMSEVDEWYTDFNKNSIHILYERLIKDNMTKFRIESRILLATTVDHLLCDAIDNAYEYALEHTKDSDGSVNVVTESFKKCAEYSTKDVVQKLIADSAGGLPSGCDSKADVSKMNKVFDHIAQSVLAKHGVTDRKTVSFDTNKSNLKSQLVNAMLRYVFDLCKILYNDLWTPFEVASIKRSNVRSASITLLTQSGLHPKDAHGLLNSLEENVQKCLTRRKEETENKKKNGVATKKVVKPAKVVAAPVSASNESETDEDEDEEEDEDDE